VGAKTTRPSHPEQPLHCPGTVLDDMAFFADQFVRPFLSADPLMVGYAPPCA